MPDAPARRTTRSAAAPGDTLLTSAAEGDRVLAAAATASATTTTAKTPWDETTPTTGSPTSLSASDEPSSDSASQERHRLVFADSFDSANLDGTKWVTCYPWADAAAGCTNAGNNEQQWYLADQVVQSEGQLHLVADRVPTNGTDRGGAPMVFPYRSGMIASAGRFSFTYGYVEFVARIPSGDAMWPALWLLPEDGSWPPEIDVMEAVGNHTTGLSLTLHGNDGTKSQQFVAGPDYALAMHTFAIDWRPASITWYVDNVARFTATRGVPSSPMYLLANLAVGGTGGGLIGPTTPRHASFDIDSVKVWQD